MASTPRDKARGAGRLLEEASAAERAGQTSRAIELLGELVRLAPDDRSSLRRLAALLERGGRPREANACYRRLAESYEHAQLDAKAIAAWKRVVQNEPHFAGAHVKVGELYAARGLRADARKHYQSALVIYRGTARKREATHIEERIAELDDQSNPGPRPAIETAEPGEGPSNGEAGGEPETGRPGGVEPVDPCAADDLEFQSERMLQARLFRRYALRDQARVQLESLLARFPDHLEARRELRDLLEEDGLHVEAAEQQRLLDALEGNEPAARAREGQAPAAAEDETTGRSTLAPTAGIKSGGGAQLAEVDADLGDLLGLAVILTDDTAARRALTGSPSTRARAGADASGVEARGPGAESGAPRADEGPPDASPDDAMVLEELELEPLDEPAAAPGEPHVAIELDDCTVTPPRLRRRVDAQVEQDDYETRYDLGIAYREMGLLDEAIAELQLASRGSRRFVECVSLLSTCFLEKQLPQLALKWLERGLAAPGLEDGQAQSLRYDLAGVLEACGDVDRARELYAEIYGEDAAFRDVAERLRRLGEGENPTAGGERGVVLPWRKR